MDGLGSGRTEVRMGVSEANKCKESRDEVDFCVAPQKPFKNAEKLIFEIGQIINIFFEVEICQMENSLKCMLAKFEGCRSLV